MIGAVVAFHDETERKAAEAAVRRTVEGAVGATRGRADRRNWRSTNTQLRASNRELQDFASVASHDLQEPLRKIQAFGDRLEAKAGARLGRRGAGLPAADAERRAARMQTLINDLLAFSRVTTQAQPFAPVDLVEGRRRGAGRSGDGGRARAAGGSRCGPLPTIDADPTQMRQLLQNLIGNALKFRDPATAAGRSNWRADDGRRRRRNRAG